MQIDRMKKHLLDTANVRGDYVDFRIYRGDTFVHLTTQADAYHRMAYGISTLEGLGEPTQHDRSSNNTIANHKGKFSVKEVTVQNVMRRQATGNRYKIFQGSFPEVLNELPDITYAFVIIDMIHYIPTKKALDYAWKRMSYSGTMYFDNYFSNEKSACSKAINEFIKEHEDEIIVSRQMVINGSKEKELAIKCLRKELKPHNWSKESLLKRPITIAMVLKTGGGIYDYKYVNNLVEGIKNNLSVDHRIVCLTDDSTGFTKSIDEVVKFKHDFPGWWSKLELFRSGLFEEQQVFYFDLDTFIVGSLDEIVFYDGEFAAIRDFYHLHTMGSGLMSWSGDGVDKIYNEFKENPQRAMNKFAREGDQGWINDCLNKPRPTINYFQDLFPNQVISYKVHCINGSQAVLPKNAKILAFHGRPKPHEITDIFKQYWKQ